MQVKIEEIKDKGLELNEAIPSELLDDVLTSSDGFVRLGNTPILKAKFRKFPGRVLLHAKYNPAVKAPCKRCLKDVEMTVPVEFELNLVAMKPEVRGADSEGEDDDHAPSGGTFDLGEVDSEPFDGKVIELDPIIREQTLLALPLTVLCEDACKGLCSQCGQDLNEKECGCDRKVVDIRLAKLKDVKLN